MGFLWGFLWFFGFASTKSSSSLSVPLTLVFIVTNSCYCLASPPLLSLSKVIYLIFLNNTFCIHVLYLCNVWLYDFDKYNWQNKSVKEHHQLLEVTQLLVGADVQVDRSWMLRYKQVTSCMGSVWDGLRSECRPFAGDPWSSQPQSPHQTLCLVEGPVGCA